MGFKPCLSDIQVLQVDTKLTNLEIKLLGGCFQLLCGEARGQGRVG